MANPANLAILTYIDAQGVQRNTSFAVRATIPNPLKNQLCVLLRHAYPNPREGTVPGANSCYWLYKYVHPQQGGPTDLPFSEVISWKVGFRIDFATVPGHQGAHGGVLVPHGQMCFVQSTMKATNIPNQNKTVFSGFKFNTATLGLNDQLLDNVVQHIIGNRGIGDAPPGVLAWVAGIMLGIDHDDFRNLNVQQILQGLTFVSSQWSKPTDEAWVL